MAEETRSFPFSLFPLGAYRPTMDGGKGKNDDRRGRGGGADFNGKGRENWEREVITLFPIRTALVFSSSITLRAVLSFLLTMSLNSVKPERKAKSNNEKKPMDSPVAVSFFFFLIFIRSLLFYSFEMFYERLFCMPISGGFLFTFFSLLSFVFVMTLLPCFSCTLCDSPPLSLSFT